MYVIISIWMVLHLTDAMKECKRIHFVADDLDSGVLTVEEGTRVCVVFRLMDENCSYPHEIQIEISSLDKHLQIYTPYCKFIERSEHCRLEHKNHSECSCLERKGFYRFSKSIKLEDATIWKWSLLRENEFDKYITLNVTKKTESGVTSATMIVSLILVSIGIIIIVIVIRKVFITKRKLRKGNKECSTEHREINEEDISIRNEKPDDTYTRTLPGYVGSEYLVPTVVGETVLDNVTNANDYIPVLEDSHMYNHVTCFPDDLYCDVAPTTKYVS